MPPEIISAIVMANHSGGRASVPSWVLSKVREMVDDGLSVSHIAGQLTALGHRCTARQVKRWKEVNKIGRRKLMVTDAELDTTVNGMIASGQAGPTEGYRWLHSAVNVALAPKRWRRSNAQGDFGGGGAQLMRRGGLDVRCLGRRGRPFGHRRVVQSGVGT